MTSEPRIGKEFYDSSDYFEEGTDHLIDTESRFQRYRINKVLSIHEPKPSDRVVDLGCGWGTFGFVLADRVAEVVGIDFSEKSVSICDKRLAANPHDNLRFLCADAGDTGLEDGQFDVVFSSAVLEHLPDPVGALRSIRRVLKPGGLLFVRDLLRPPDLGTLDSLVSEYTGQESPHARQMFRDSLHAALTLEEIQTLLAELGADVIRIEKTAGSEDRFLVPVSDGGPGALFLQMGRNKRGMTLDPKTPEGAEIVAKLVATADVVVANLPPQALATMGIDYDSLAAIKPDVV